MTPVIQAAELRKTFKVGLRGKAVHALRGLSLEVAEGEVFGFLGPNGAGKTTAIKLFLGLLFPTSGTVTVLGRPPGDPTAKRTIGFLPEQPSFYDYLTAEEFLEFYASLDGLSMANRRARTASLLAQVGLSAAKDLQLRKFSKGMLQRIGIAQALLGDPRLVILDEPMSGLDPVGRKGMRDIVLRLRDQGKTVFFSTHILPDVEMICDRIGILVNGQMRQIGRLDEIWQTETTSIEVTVRGLPPEALQACDAHASRTLTRGDQVLIIVDDEEALDKVLDLVRTHKARLVSVVPHRRSLEEVFLKEVQP